MNFRTIFLSGIVLLGLGATFGFKSEKRVLFGADWIWTSSGPDLCMKNTGVYANETICSPWSTGPVCTVTPSGLSTRTAYYPAAPTGSCMMPWRQP